MDAQRIATADRCLNGSHEGSMSFPQIVGTLIEDGFEGYFVDYRRNVASYYLPDGDSVELNNVQTPGTVAADFDAVAIQAAVREAQANGPDYSYEGFCRKAKAAGCAGYIVSFSGRRVLYFGRTAETYVEPFPQ
jgi:uncharacterized protein YbcV (DUF1398 family)